nr:unnamed protein product [Callosobruchus analis]
MARKHPNSISTESNSDIRLARTPSAFKNLKRCSSFFSNNKFENANENDDGSMGLPLQEVLLKTLEPYKYITNDRSSLLRDP